MQPLSFAPVLILVVLAIGTGADAKPRTYVLGRDGRAEAG